MKAVKLQGPVVVVPISEFKPDDLMPLLADGTEALIVRNKETLGVFMTVERRNQLVEG